MTACRLLLVVGCASAVGCSRTPDGFVRGNVSGSSSQGALRVAVGTAWNQDPVAVTSPVAADGSFAVPADAASVIVFDDLDRDEHLTPWVDRSFFCVRGDDWRCEVAPSRIVIRTLEDHDDATHPVEVLWFAAPDVSPPELCVQDECRMMTLHERGAHSFTQVCESMRNGALRVARGGETPVLIPLAVEREFVALVDSGHDASSFAAWLSSPINRARVSAVDRATGTEHDLVVELAAAGRIAFARSPVACEEPACSMRMHLARLTAQERYDDLLVDRVDELIEDVP